MRCPAVPCEVSLRCSCCSVELDLCIDLRLDLSLLVRARNCVPLDAPARAIDAALVLRLFTSRLVRIYLLVIGKRRLEFQHNALTMNLCRP